MAAPSDGLKAGCSAISPEAVGRGHDVSFGQWVGGAPTIPAHAHHTPSDIGDLITSA
jgi:hypothetical protein